MQSKVLSLFLFGVWTRFVLVAVQEQCRVEFNKQGMALTGFVFKKFSARGPHVCDDRCDRELTCQSSNYVIETSTCELNNRTKEARPENFKPDPARFYIGRLNNRGTYCFTGNPRWVQSCKTYRFAYVTWRTRFLGNHVFFGRRFPSNLELYKRLCTVLVFSYSFRLKKPVYIFLRFSDIFIKLGFEQLYPTQIWCFQLLWRVSSKIFTVLHFFFSI